MGVFNWACHKDYLHLANLDSKPFVVHYMSHLLTLYMPYNTTGTVLPFYNVVSAISHLYNEWRQDYTQFVLPFVFHSKHKNLQNCNNSLSFAQMHYITCTFFRHV